MKRNRSKRHSFEDRLAEAATKFEAQAGSLWPGKEQRIIAEAPPDRCGGAPKQSPGPTNTKEKQGAREG